MRKRTYTEDEMARLLERAASLQANAAKHAQNRPGLTLGELEDIAAEAGLDPIHLRQAAAELFDPSVDVSHRKSSTSASHVYVDQWVAAELTDECWEEIEAELRHRFDSDLTVMMNGGMMTDMGYGKGKSTQVGRRREWKHTSMSGVETRLMVQPRGESVQLKLSQRVGWGSPMSESIMYGSSLAFLAAMITGGVMDSVMMAAIVLVGVMAVAVPLIQWADKKWRDKKHRALEELADRVAGIMANYARDNAPQMTYEDVALSSRTYPEEKVSRIDPSLLDTDQEEHSEERSPARKRTKG